MSGGYRPSRGISSTSLALTGCIASFLVERTVSNDFLMYVPQLTLLSSGGLFERHERHAACLSSNGTAWSTSGL